MMEDIVGFVRYGVIPMLHQGVSLQPFIGSSGGPWLKSALQLGIGGPGLKSFGLPNKPIGGFCALAGGIYSLAFSSSLYYIVQQ